ncbi:hypothetical protein L3Q82_024161, partial [Scortum barcoo]
DYEYANHPQSTQHQKNDRCPPPPQMLPERACEVPGCRSDSECERHKRCCYNGCIYACLESVQPPPVLDWLVQPKPRWLGGNGWLLDGPEEVLQAEACSTTEDGDEPLHCPTGYECHIINPGNPAAGIPNRGQCIKQRGNSDGRGLRHKYFKDYKDYLDLPDLSLSYDQDTTSDISSSPVQSALITPEPGSDLTSLPDLQLLPPLCKAPSCRKVLWETTLKYPQYTAKESVCEKDGAGGVAGEAEEKEIG